VNPYWIEFHWLYISILIFRHISRCYEEQKMIATCFLSLFSLGLGQEKDLTASMHGRMLSSTLKRMFLSVFQFVLNLHRAFKNN